MHRIIQTMGKRFRKKIKLFKPFGPLWLVTIKVIHYVITGDVFSRSEII